MDRNLLKENRIHGDAIYPLSIYNIICSSSHILDCHWHDEQEFLMVTEGKATFQIGTAYYEVLAGQAIFISSGELHAGYPIDHSSCSFSAMVFNSDMLCSSTYDSLQEKYVDPFAKRQVEFPAHLQGLNQWEKEVLKLIHEIIMFNTKKLYAYELETKARLYLILSRLMANSRPLTLSSAYPRNDYKVERLKNVLNYIHSNYQEKISLRELASQINMSEGHFCRFFKQMVKKTPIEYLNYFRIQKSAKLLENSDKKIYEIALDVGFDNFSYFITIFKAYMGCTPKEHRDGFIKL